MNIETLERIAEKYMEKIETVKKDYSPVGDSHFNHLIGSLGQISGFTQLVKLGNPWQNKKKASYNA
tara:strand:- start:756 stop:953 length:198 start_codon:yes stop_codon:yes gene_type:complete